MRKVRRIRIAAAALGLGIAAFAPSAGASPGSPSDGPAPATAPPATAQPTGGTSPKRPVPDYDGRPAPGTSAGEALLWVPRVVTFPLYAVTDFVIRRPLGLLITTAERDHWVDSLTNLFTFGPSHHVGVVPTALFDFGMRTSVGVYFFYDDFLAKDNQLRLHAAYGGPEWYRLTVSDRIPVDKEAYLKLRGEASIRPDFLFYGLGSRSLEATRSRYEARSIDGAATFHFDLGPGASVEAWAGVKAIRFEADETCCRNVSLGDRIRAGQLAKPPGLDGYAALRQGLRLTLDSRRPRPEPGGGFRFEGSAQHSFDLHDPARSRWVSYGATVGATLDLTGHSRLLTLSVGTRFADPLSEAAVPFTELATLGGDQVMYGFLANRLLGRSAATATLEYRYPIWALIDGSVRASVGNVFGAHLEDFSPRLLRTSFDFGIRTTGAEDHTFNVMLGFGTETFEDGTRPNQIRLLFGGTSGL